MFLAARVGGWGGWWVTSGVGPRSEGAGVVLTSEGGECERKSWQKCRVIGRARHKRS